MVCTFEFYVLCVFIGFRFCWVFEFLCQASTCLYVCVCVCVCVEESVYTHMRSVSGECQHGGTELMLRLHGFKV